MATRKPSATVKLPPIQVDRDVDVNERITVNGVRVGGEAPAYQAPNADPYGPLPSPGNTRAVRDLERGGESSWSMLLPFLGVLVICVLGIVGGAVYFSQHNNTGGQTKVQERFPQERQDMLPPQAERQDVPPQPQYAPQREAPPAYGPRSGPRQDGRLIVPQDMIKNWPVFKSTQPNVDAPPGTHWEPGRPGDKGCHDAVMGGRHRLVCPNVLVKDHR